MPRKLLKEASFGGLHVVHDLAPRELWGEMTGHQCRKVVWHTTESDPGSIDGVAEWVHSEESQYHLLWDGTTGDVRVLMPANVGARALKNGRWGFPTNRYGQVAIQIGVVGRAVDRPLGRDAEMQGIERLRRWLRSWGVPELAVNGGTAHPRRSHRQWKKSGHHTHSSCPGNDHHDPGWWAPGVVFGDEL